MFVKHWSGILAALALMAGSYAGFYWLTKQRLNEPGLRTRMYVFCRLIEVATDIKPNEEVWNLKHFENKVEEILEETGRVTSGGNTDLLVKMTIQSVNLEQDAAKNQKIACPDYGSMGLLNVNREKLDARQLSYWIALRLKRMSESPPPSYAFLTALEELRLGLTCIKEACPQNNFDTNTINDNSILKWRTRFIISDYLRKGVDFRSPEGDLSQLRSDALLFLTYRNMFRCGRISSLPTSLKFRPWLLLRAYDSRRFNLCETIPIAVGVLGLAVGLFVQIRLTDVIQKDKTLTWRGESERWIHLWANGALITPATESCEHSVSAPEPCKMRLFANSVFWPLVLGFIIVSLLVEFFLNTPQTLHEWIPNIPIMTLTGGMLAVLWWILWDIGGQKLNSELGQRTRAFRARLLRPLFTATAALMLAITWGLAYSIINLAHLSAVQNARSIFQVVMLGFTAGLIIRVLWKVHCQLQKLPPPPKDRKQTAELEEEMNQPSESDLLVSLIPAELDEKLLQAAFIVLLPLPQVLHLLVE